MLLKRGDIALALFPDSNLRTAKRRPVLVVQAEFDCVIGVWPDMSAVDAAVRQTLGL